jgi:hypothetical protein
MTTARFIALSVFAIAFGIEEAIIVVYLRHLPSSASNLYALEMLREACTLFIIGAIAYVAAASANLRARAFCFAFGVWDVVYYLALVRLSGYPTLADNDILFLIPVPWVAPVWSAVAFALALVFIGLFGIEAPRRWLLAVGFGLGLFSFVFRALFGAHDYPLWLFVLAFACVLAALPIRDVPERLRQF